MITARGGHTAMYGALVLALGLTSCIDERLVGTRLVPAAVSCEPGCDADELCHPELIECVGCVENTDCERSLSGPLCDEEAHECRLCEVDETCPPWLCEDDDDPGEVDDDCDLDERDDDDLPDFCRGILQVLTAKQV